MKFLRKYEENYVRKVHIPKFEIGDAVKIKNDPSHTIYAINGYDYQSGFQNKTYLNDKCRLTRYEDRNKLADREGFYSWVPEYLLESVPDYEIKAKNYNL